MRTDSIIIVYHFDNISINFRKNKIFGEMLLKINFTLIYQPNSFSLSIICQKNLHSIFHNTKVVNFIQIAYYLTL